jgi:hypothetical protein
MENTSISSIHAPQTAGRAAEAEHPRAPRCAAESQERMDIPTALEPPLRVVVQNVRSARHRGQIGRIWASDHPAGVVRVRLDSGERVAGPPSCFRAAPYRVCVITSCTASKSADSAGRLTLADLHEGGPRLKRREHALRRLSRPAESMYRGAQHRRLMRGITAFRAAYSADRAGLDLYILSAGYGLIAGSRVIAPYEATFTEMGRYGRQCWGERLGVPGALRRVVRPSYDLGMVLLGSGYLDACGVDRCRYTGRFPPPVEFGGPTLVLCGGSETRLRGERVFRTLIPDTATRTFGCGQVGLKGELAARVLERLARDLTFADELRHGADFLSLLRTPLDLTH